MKCVDFAIHANYQCYAEVDSFESLLSNCPLLHASLGLFRDYLTYISQDI